MVSSLQVDGGPEFVVDFEVEYAKRKLPLFALPPIRPQWNDRVECCNDTLAPDVLGAVEWRSSRVGGVRRPRRAPALA